MLVGRYVHKMVFRILDAEDPSPELVASRNAIIEKLQKAWIKASKGFEKEWKSYAAEFKKAQKAKKEPLKSLLSKVNKLVKTISAYCKNCAKFYQKLISGNPTKAEQQKVGVVGKIAEIPKGVDKNKLSRMVKAIPVDFVVEETKLLSALKKELDPYYDVQTQTLKQPVGVAMPKPETKPEAIFSPSPEKPKTNTILSESSTSSSKSPNAAQEDKIIKRLKEIYSRIKELDNETSYIYFTKLNSLRSVGAWSDKELSELKNKANKIIDEVYALIDEARRLWPKALNTDDSWRLYQNISHDGEDESISPYKLSLKSIHAIDREFWVRKHANELFNTFNIFPPHN